MSTGISRDIAADAPPHINIQPLQRRFRRVTLFLSRPQFLLNLILQPKKYSHIQPHPYVTHQHRPLHPALEKVFNSQRSRKYPHSLIRFQSNPKLLAPSATIIDTGTPIRGDMKPKTILTQLPTIYEDETKSPLQDHMKPRTPSMEMRNEDIEDDVHMTPVPRKESQVR